MASNSLTDQINAVSAASGGSGASAPDSAAIISIGQNLKNPITVPNRNLANLPIANFTNNSSGINSEPVFDETQINKVLQPSGSNFFSSQLPVGSGADINSNGIIAGSTTSIAANQQFTNLVNTQLGVSDATVSFPTDAATPVDVGNLQGINDVFNNAIGTTSNIGNNFLNSDSQPGNGADKWDRVKLRYKPGHPMAMYPNMLRPLARTTGLVWLYKPSVQIQSAIDYETLALTHSIQEVHAFSSNRAAQITVSGQFVSQNLDEAMYSLAAIHFLRSVSKMSFGSEAGITSDVSVAQTPLGSPPPVLLLSGYGTLMMNDLPVIVTNFSFDLPPDVDYIEVPSGPGFGTKIPVSFSLAVSLVVQQAPQDMRSFNVDNFTRFGIKSWW